MWEHKTFHEVIPQLIPRSTTAAKNAFASVSFNFGVPIIIDRNLDFPRSCNVTRLVVRKMTSYVLKATVITGKHVGVDAFIPLKGLFIFHWISNGGIFHWACASQCPLI